MLLINHLTIQYGNKYLFKDICACIGRNDRIGLVGVNGAGKSTLLKIINGAVESDHGVVTCSKNFSIGYLPQEVVSVVGGRTLYQEAETAFADTISLQEELDRIGHKLGGLEVGGPEFTHLIERYGEIQYRLEQSNIFRIRSRIEKVLTGLGFKEADFNRDCLSFSGGWLMRLMLAKLLLIEPSLLLLDEPTNHLDLETVTWLEEFIKSYSGALVVISHDRAFLDSVTNLTWELSMGRLTVYKGNYSRYVAEKEARLKVQRAAHANQQAEIQQTMRFVERFRAKSSKARQVQSRVRQLEKMERIELEESEQNISFSFPPAAPSGRLAVQVSDLSKCYGGKTVFNSLSFELMRGDKMAVVGVNGAGKSTLIRLIAGLERPDAGYIRFGHNVKISYFGQHQAQDLAPDLSVLETLSEAADPEMTITQIRSLLGAFLFRGDEVDKKVRVLSGGEKSRLALARMIATPANLLLMDEPTNHLDMMSQEILQEAMRRYDGSVVVVSHNRYFLDGFINKTLDIKNGHASLFEGNIGEYLAMNRVSSNVTVQPTEEMPPFVEAGEDGTSRPKGKEYRHAKAKLRQEKSRLISSLKKKNTEIEAEIASLEARKAELEEVMASPRLYTDRGAFLDLSNEYKEIGKHLEQQYQIWEEVQAELEMIEARSS